MFITNGPRRAVRTALRRAVVVAGSAALVQGAAPRAAVAMPSLSASAAGRIDWENTLIFLRDLIAQPSLLNAPSRAGKNFSQSSASYGTSSMGCAHPSPPSAQCPSDDNSSATRGWLGLKPRASILARDWSSTFPIAGGALSLNDQFRLARATRMAIARVHVTSGQWSPYVDIGVGQWRVPTWSAARVSRYEEIAGQISIGVDIELTPSWHIGLEQSGTVLYRERGGSTLPPARSWNAAIASRLEF